MAGQGGFWLTLANRWPISASLTFFSQGGKEGQNPAFWT
jgi:hypothetical protein